jgi:hypothetical protein
MAFFVDEAEVHRYVGGILRLAGSHPVVGPRLAEARTTLTLDIGQPDAEITVVWGSTNRVVLGPAALVPDVTFRMSGDDLDRFWRGRYDLLDGLARGDVAVSGQVSRVLKVVPHLQPMFPVYEALVRLKAPLAPVSPEAGRRA